MQSTNITGVQWSQHRKANLGHMHFCQMLKEIQSLYSRGRWEHDTEKEGVGRTQKVLLVSWTSKDLNLQRAFPTINTRFGMASCAGASLALVGGSLLFGISLAPFGFPQPGRKQNCFLGFICYPCLIYYTPTAVSPLSPPPVSLPPPPLSPRYTSYLLSEKNRHPGDIN